jgi:hypothetical protein
MHQVTEHPEFVEPVAVDEARQALEIGLGAALGHRHSCPSERRPLAEMEIGDEANTMGLVDPGPVRIERAVDGGSPGPGEVNPGCSRGGLGVGEWPRLAARL